MRQIFVIGKNRSGTKWMSNIVARHPTVVAIQREGAGGVVESNLFSHYPRMFGDLVVTENRLAFLSCFRNDNFFRLSGLDEQWLYRLEFDDYLDVLEALMEAYAQRRGAQAWVQKADSLVLPTLLSRFPRAKFVIIQRRNIADNVASTLALHAGPRKARTNPGQLFKEVMSYHHHRKIQESKRRLPNVQITAMEALKSQRADRVRDVCEFLDLTFDEVMLEDSYRPNTSFTGQQKRGNSLGERDKEIVAVWDRALKHVPLPVLKAIASLWLQFRASRGRERLLRRTFSIYSQELEEQLTRDP